VRSRLGEELERERERERGQGRRDYGEIGGWVGIGRLWKIVYVLQKCEPFYGFLALFDG
jgi:hypothetical protein